MQLNAVDGAGNTALMDAIRHNHKEVQAALRGAGANLAAVNVADKLCLAAAENDTAILEVCPPSPLVCFASLTALVQRLALVLMGAPRNRLMLWLLACSSMSHHGDVMLLPGRHNFAGFSSFFKHSQAGSKSQQWAD